MKQTPSLAAMLSVEDDRAILEFYCAETGVLLWPYIRALFFRMIISDFYYDQPLITVTTFRKTGAKAFETLAKSVLHNARMRFGMQYRADVCIMPTGIGNHFSNGKWFNRLSDYFALALPMQSLVIEGQSGWEWTLPKVVRRAVFQAPMQAGAAVVGRLLVRDVHAKRARDLIRLVSDRAQQLLGWELGVERGQRLVTVLGAKAAALPHSYRQYRNLLQRVGPKVLMKEDACYGQSAALMCVAKDLGITTAEYQHGVVSAGHDAYNLAPALAASPEYRKTLPEYFLSYGDWWSEQVSLPLKKISIGNPHREAQVALFSHVHAEKHDILVLGDGVETERYLTLCRFLADNLTVIGLRTVFRPHPAQRAAVRNLCEKGIREVSIDETASIYSALTTAYAVVGEHSTGLFEAIGLADRVYMWNTGKANFGLPSHPFKVFDSANQLIDMLKVDAPFFGGSVKSLWKPNWRDNYLSFLGRCGVTTKE
jgi:hypothetical protein